MQMTKIFEELRGLSRMRPLPFLVIAAIMGLVAWHSCVLKFCVTDPDIWWHLRVGDWIIANRTVPHVGIFSRTAANMPWVAYSWGYEVLLSLAYRGSGIFGIGVFGVVLTMVVAYAIMSMLRRLSGSFWIACGLSGATYFSMLFTMMPRPHFFSIALFVLVITMLLDAQQNASVASLRWLPFIFLVWANLHIQFIYGLFLFGLFVAVNLAQRAAVALGAYPRYVQPPTLPAKWLVVLFAISVLATLVGPNTYHVYRVIFEYSRANFGYLYIRELQALDFRFPEHFGQLLLTGAAFLVVGWQNKIDPFKLGLLTICALVAFRTTRDGWFICIPAAACIADFFHDFQSEPDRMESLAENSALFAVVALLIALIFPNIGFTPRALDSAVRGKFPVDAVNYLRQYPVPGPLYNSFNWGGFLIWYMPEYPVAIDGRNDLYGDELDVRFFGVQDGLASYSDDTFFKESRLILLNNREYLSERLSRDPQYKILYQDALAVVFVPQSPRSPGE
jgi:hypothetical protein